MPPKYLPERDIQQLERLDDEQLASAIRGKELTVIRGLLSSFRLTALVANAAWKMHETRQPEAEEQFLAALAAYAPDLRQQPLPGYNTRLQEAKGIYFSIREGMSAKEVESLLYRRILELEDKIEESGT